MRADELEITKEVSLTVAHDADTIVASQQGRTLAAGLGFSVRDQTAITIAILEVARNIIIHAGRGTVTLRTVRGNTHSSPADRGGKSRGIVVVAHDEGPGISDIEQAVQDGHSTTGGLGLGLPGARRMMDEFEIVSEVGKGTTVTMRKWIG